MIHNLLHEDKELKRVAHTPKDQKPRFEWSAWTAGIAESTAASAIKVHVGGDERDFDMGEIADTVGSALASRQVSKTHESSSITCSSTIVNTTSVV